MKATYVQKEVHGLNPLRYVLTDTAGVLEN